MKKKRHTYWATVLILLVAGCFSPKRVVELLPDETPPKIVITKPNSKGTRAIAVIESDQKITVEGFVVDNVKVTKFEINDMAVSVLENGFFSHKIKALPQMNRYRLVAVDSSSNITHKMIEIQGKKSIEHLPKQQKYLAPAQKPSLWVLAIGVSTYNNPNMSLKYADNDALALARVLKKEEGHIFSEVFTKTLINDQATRGNIFNAMTQYLFKAAPNDVVFIFLAGHGLKNPQTGSYYFLPFNGDNQNYIYEGISMSEFDETKKMLSQHTNKIIIILDTCHSGAMNLSMRNLEAGVDLAKAMQASDGIYILSSSKEGEVSIEDPSFKLPGETKGHGAFTYAFLKGIKGEANYDKNSYITINELFDYVSAKVPRITNGQQHPYSKVSGTFLPFIFYDQK